MVHPAQNAISLNEVNAKDSNMNAFEIYGVVVIASLAGWAAALLAGLV